MSERHYHTAKYIGGPLDGKEVKFRIRKDGSFSMPSHGIPSRRNDQNSYAYVVKGGNYVHPSVVHGESDGSAFG